MPPWHPQIPLARMLEGSHRMAGGKQGAHPVVGYLLKGFAFKLLNAKNGDWRDYGLRNKEREKTLDFFFLGLQWAELLGHWVLVTTQRLETSISLQKEKRKKHKQLYLPISNSSPGDQNTHVPQTKSLIIRHTEFKLTRNTPESEAGTPIFVSKEHFNRSMWIGGKAMKEAVFEQGIMHLIPSGWIRGIPGQAGSS